MAQYWDEQCVKADLQMSSIATAEHSDHLCSANYQLIKWATQSVIVPKIQIVERQSNIFFVFSCATRVFATRQVSKEHKIIF